MTKLFYILSKDVLTGTKSFSTYDDHYIKKFGIVTKRYWMNQSADQKNNTKYTHNKMQFLICQQQLKQYHRDINRFLKKGSKVVPFKKYQTPKICRNSKCDKNNFDNQRLNLKLCARCKSVYYCSRECQKIDWNRFHRLHCDLLFIHLCL